MAWKQLSAAYILIGQKKFLFYHISQKLKAISKMNGLWILFLCVCSEILRSACVYQAQSLQNDIYLIEKT